MWDWISNLWSGVGNLFGGGGGSASGAGIDAFGAGVDPYTGYTGAAAGAGTAGGGFNWGSLVPNWGFKDYMGALGQLGGLGQLGLSIYGMANQPSMAMPMAPSQGYPPQVASQPSTMAPPPQPPSQATAPAAAPGVSRQQVSDIESQLGGASISPAFLAQMLGISPEEAQKAMAEMYGRP